MIAYATLGTNDILKASTFYDTLLAGLGAKRVMESDRLILWGTAAASPMLAVCKPYNGKPATVGNGMMISLGVDSAETVAAMHKKAIDLGCKDEGAPGPRGPAFTIGYFRDLDGNKLNFFHAAG